MDIDKLEEYFESLEHYFFSSVSTLTSGLPDVQETVNRLWVDISRYGPGLPAFPEVRLPALGDFQVPPPPPPPPAPRPSSWLENSCVWITKHPWRTFGLIIGATSTGLLLVGYSRAYTHKRHLQNAKGQRYGRRQVVVVLGGDTAFALPLILDLERKGYIVIASVSNPEACNALESKCQGYVRALVLDPSEPATTNAFLRSLMSTLSLRFPINSAGDPFVSTSTQPYIHSIISLLTLFPGLPLAPAPLEHISLTDTYVPYLTATQITPLRAIQALLPLLRTNPRDKGNKSIIVCLPATEARVGIPFASVQSMSVGGMLRGVEVLRREINIASLMDKSGSMKNIKVAVAEVGALQYDNASHTSHSVEDQSVPDLYKAMEDWTVSEKASYGPAFAAFAHDSLAPRSFWQSLKMIFENDSHFGIPRQPTDVSRFVDRIVDIVGDGKFGLSLFGLGIVWRRARNAIRGERFSVGAGATTYKIASRLPPLVLDTLLNLPAFLISIRNRLLPAQPFVLSPGASAPPANPPAAPIERDATDDDEATSEWEAESNASEAAESSWIRLHRTQEGENS
ncbi:hypothetical protein AX15_006267 [Amanita polypyramis BW_CC]|nr:hypothetical protein AX15_006267 [Amanita polypyramis BW_CC]